ncbi:hypothetical protein [Devosia sp.]|uniref:hypothetical protein n=1 Tax=Devosia sp. TaxID=1871048 RepID=UPI00326478DB
MTTAIPAPISATRSMPVGLAVVSIPLLFVVLGLAIRYAAFYTGHPGATAAEFAQGLCRWDCGWYVRIAETGYDPFPVPTMINAGNWAFFPFYPTVIGVLRLIFVGAPTMVIATVASIIFTWIAVVVAWPLFERNWRAYTLYAAFLLSGPFSIYFTTFYTEVMFLLLITCVFAALKRQNYLLAGCFAALLSATRIVGVFIVFAIVLQAYLDHRAQGGTFKSFLTTIWTRTDLLLGIFIAPLGLFIYMAFLHYKIGDALAFQHDQRAWGRVTGSPFGYLWKALTNFPGSGFIPSASQQLAVGSIAGIALSIWLGFRKQLPAAVFCGICLVLPLFAGMASMMRFVAGLPPLSIELMKLLSRNKVSTVLFLLLFLVLDFEFTLGWLGGALALV